MGCLSSSTYQLHLGPGALFGASAADLDLHGSTITLTPHHKGRPGQCFWPMAL